MSWVQRWVGCLLSDSEILILSAESSQNPSQNFCYSHYLNFYVLSGSLNLISELNSSLRHIIVTFVYLIATIKSPVVVETPVTKAEADNISHRISSGIVWYALILSWYSSNLSKESSDFCLSNLDKLVSSEWSNSRDSSWNFILSSWEGASSWEIKDIILKHSSVQIYQQVLFSMYTSDCNFLANLSFTRPRLSPFFYETSRDHETRIFF